MNTANKTTLSATLVGTVLAVIFLVQAILSRAAGYDLFAFLTGFGTCAAIVFSYWWWLYRQQAQLSFGIVLFWALIFRLIGIYGDPILEDDYYRYLLDACLFATYGTPYGISPESLFFANALTSDCEALLSGVNNPDLATIYAPFLQYVFALSHFISPVNIDLLQLIVVLFDLSVIIVLGRLAPARTVLLYAWCPLVIKEFAFTAHPDVIGVALLLAAVTCKAKGKIAWGCVLVAMAACTKILAVLAIPFFLFRQPLRYWLITILTGALLYLPFLIQAQHSDLEILAHFANTWMFNAPIFVQLSSLLSDQWARYVSFAVFLACYAYYFYRYHAMGNSTAIARFDWIFGVLFLLSPVLNAWYWVWILPFAVLWPSCWAWTASVVLMLSYSIGLHLPDSQLRDYEVHRWAQWIQMIAIGVALIVDYRYQRFRLSNHR